MPSVEVNYSNISAQTSSHDNIVSTPLGLSLLDIQGVLNVPREKIADGAEYIKIDEIYDAVKFGKLQFDAKDQTKVTMIIGNSQRLVGSIVKLATPLGVLKIPKGDDNDKKEIQMIDIIRNKIVFKNRPLPIM